MRRLYKAVLLAVALTSSAANASDVQDRIVQSILGQATVTASTPGLQAEAMGRYDERLAAAISPQDAPKHTSSSRVPMTASSTQPCPSAAITGA